MLKHIDNVYNPKRKLPKIILKKKLKKGRSKSTNRKHKTIKSVMGKSNIKLYKKLTEAELKKKTEKFYMNYHRDHFSKELMK
jgi:hypothetical protein